MNRETLRVIPLGGLGEIGRNMMALEAGEDIVVIDCGLLFPKEDMLGIDKVLPDISYLVANKDRVRAILITHGHEDHIGALPHVLRDLDVPVYASRLAHGLITVKLREHKALRGHKVEEIEPGVKYRFGDMTAEWFRVTHSIPDAMGIALWTPAGLVVHTGDFKIDHTPADGKIMDLARLATLSTEGVLLLLSDSTYAERGGHTLSECVVGDALHQEIGDSSGRVMVATFASLISRMQQVINAAVDHGRKVSVVGRSMVNNLQMATKMGYITAPEGTLVSPADLGAYAPEESLILSTGSQGEPTSVLVRVANQDHRDISVAPGDTIILSSHPIPGNEMAVAKVIDNLCRQGARVLHSGTSLVHVHGHASQEELKLMLNMVKPKYFVPVHGEYRHLIAHASLAKAVCVEPDNVFVLEDGDVLELTPEGGKVVEQVPAGMVFVDGLRLWDMASGVLQERRSISRNGILVAVVAVDSGTGKVVRLPEIVSNGLVEGDEARELYDKTAQAIKDALNQGEPMLDDLANAQVRIKETAASIIHKEIRRRPTIIPIVIEF
jgi:ribonuclease J